MDFSLIFILTVYLFFLLQVIELFANDRGSFMYFKIMFDESTFLMLFKFLSLLSLAVSLISFLLFHFLFMIHLRKQIASLIHTHHYFFLPPSISQYHLSLKWCHVIACTILTSRKLLRRIVSWLMRLSFLIMCVRNCRTKTIWEKGKIQVNL